MMFLFVLFVSGLLAVLQLTLFSKLAFWWFSPNLILAVILAYGISRRGEGNKWLVLIPALTLDLLAGRFFGFLTLSLWLSFYLIDWLIKILFRQNNLQAIIFLTILGIIFFELSLVVFVWLAGFLGLTGRIYFEPFYFYARIPLSVLGNGIFCLFFIWLWQKVVLRRLKI